MPNPPILKLMPRQNQQAHQPNRRKNRRKLNHRPLATTQPGCLRLSILKPGQPFSIGDVDLPGAPVTIPHDAADPVGFVFSTEGIRLGFATDLGYVTPNVKAQLKRLDLLLLESNHDLEMLRDGPYPWQVKQRVLFACWPSLQRCRS